MIGIGILIVVRHQSSLCTSICNKCVNNINYPAQSLMSVIVKLSFQ